MLRIAAGVAMLFALAPIAHAGAPETDPVRRSLVVEATEHLSPAVVNISAEQTVVQQSPFRGQPDPFFDQFFRDFFDSRPRRSTRTSLGSGFIVNADGTILTNSHVIMRGAKVTVTLVDGREFEAKLVGADADSDLAVLRISAGEPLPTAPLGTSSDLLIGETVIAIGNPFGLSHTVTTGVVSATGRSLHGEDRTYTDYVQTDASINPGNSGGPLSNIRGEVIGVNAAIYGKAQGIGFAIPIDRAKRVLRELVSYGEVKRTWIGVFTQELTPELAHHFGVKKGVIVATVEPKSPAADAGLVRGDVVLKLDGREVASPDEFEGRIADHQIGDDIKLTISGDEDGTIRDVTVRVTAFPTPTRTRSLVAARLRGASRTQRARRDEGAPEQPGRTHRAQARRPRPRPRGRAVQTHRGAAAEDDRVARRAQRRPHRRRGPYEYNVQVPLARRVARVRWSSAATSTGSSGSRSTTSFSSC
jgi:Do/DeqQ family serine protease